MGLCWWISPALIAVTPVHEVIDVIVFGMASSIVCILGPWMLKDPSSLRLIPVNCQINSFAGRMAPRKMQLASVVGLVVLAEDLIETNMLNGFVWELRPVTVVKDWSNSSFLYGLSAFITLPRTVAPV